MRDYTSESEMREWIDCITFAFSELYQVTGSTENFWSGEAYDAFLREREEAACLADKTIDQWQHVLRELIPIGPGLSDKDMRGCLLPEDIIK